METRLPPDFKEFLRLLAEERIEYLLVGGYAVGFHGFPRPTGDLDIWIATSPENARRMVSALGKFGFASAGASQDLFTQPDRIVRMGVPPVRVEVMSSVSGLQFGECYARRVIATIDGVEASVISKADLVRNKAAAGRPKDLADLEQLNASRPDVDLRQ
jgi:hypothetical protein